MLIVYIKILLLPFLQSMQHDKPLMVTTNCLLQHIVVMYKPLYLSEFKICGLYMAH